MGSMSGWASTTRPSLKRRARDFSQTGVQFVDEFVKWRLFAQCGFSSLPR